MQIAIIGTGAIGSSFAYQLAKVGHAVTVIARGTRLEQLQREKAIVLVTGERAEVLVVPALDPATPYDLLLATVLAPQVEAILPALQASAAKTVMFMFNTFDPIEPLREAVGPGRFAFGFPMGVFARLIDGRLKHQLSTGTTVTDPRWAAIFSEAGIASATTDDMHSWLRSHAALMIPMMSMGCTVVAHSRGISWQESGALVRAMSNAFRLVRGLGNRVTPSAVALLSRLPGVAVRTLFWIFSRTQMTHDLGLLGPGEARMLIDQMTAAAPGKTEPLLAVRP